VPNLLSVQGALPTLTYLAAKFLPISFGTAMLYAPLVVSSLLVIPMILIGRLYKNTFWGVCSALIASIVGTCAAIALARFGRFRGRIAFSSMIYAPLVMPEVITGLSLLLLFVALDIPRGFWTVVVAHATLGMCFVAVVVHARLVTLDRSLEEAAMDLGATPGRALLQVTLPLAAPSILAGYALAFILSVDDVVIASFTSGPGSTTLPMRIYSQVRLGVTPEINAVSAILIGMVAVILAGGYLVGLGKSRQV
jgi:putrescine transport system permease protein